MSLKSECSLAELAMLEPGHSSSYKISCAPREDSSCSLNSVRYVLYGSSLVRLSLLTMTNPNQLCNVLLFVRSKMADETNPSSKLPVADRTREV